MNYVLAVDLAWSGVSGWCLWNEEDAYNPLLTWGEFSPKGGRNVGETADMLYVFFGHLFDEIYQSYGNLAIVYETTDWFQPLPGWHDDDDRQRYARERVAQRSLGQAEAIFCLAYHHSHMTPPPTRLGVAEARRKFGAKDKTDVLRVLLMEYPQIFTKPERGWLRHIPTGMLISDHVTDAIVLAKVYAREMALQERIG